MRDFLFTEFAEGRPVEFLRVGTFTDAHGQEVVISDEVLDALVANFAADQAGQDVPIDVEHKRAEAAGWVTKVWRDGDRLLASVNWNELGERMVGERIYRYMSATIDLARRVLKSISLVNFPAVKGLRPVELSEGVVGIELQEGLLARIMAAIQGVFKAVEDVDGGDDSDGEGGDDGDVEAGETAESGNHESASHEEVGDMTEEELKKIREEERAKLQTELSEQRQREAELREEIRTEERAKIEAEMAERAKLREFADEICGGDAGLSTDPAELVELMAGMDETQLALFQAVLQAKVVDFSEAGSSRDGSAGLKTLPEEMAVQLSAWVKEGQTVDEWFELNSDVVDGAQAEYDLSEFEAAGE